MESIHAYQYLIEWEPKDRADVDMFHYFGVRKRDVEMGLTWDHYVWYPIYVQYHTSTSPFATLLGIGRFQSLD